MNLDSFLHECNNQTILGISSTRGSFPLDNFATPYIFVSGYNNSSLVSHYLREIYLEGNYHIGYLNLSQKISLDSIQIDHVSISEEDFLRIFHSLKDGKNDTGMTSFSIFLLVALTYFQEKNVPLFILETSPSFALNLGKRVLTIISDFPSNNEKEYLALFSNNVPTLIGEVEEKQRKICLRESQKKQSPLFFSKEIRSPKYDEPYYRFSYEPYKNLEILSASCDLLKSTALVVETVQLLRSRFPLNENDIRKGLLENPLPCKLERFHNVLVDDSHNYDGILSLTKSLQNLKKSEDVYVLFASERNSSILSSLSLLSKNAQEVVLTTFEGENARKEEDYASYCSQFSYQEDWKMALHNFLIYHKNAWILLTGSRAFANQARKYLAEVLKL